jgi:hypothetical protein
MFRAEQFRAKAAESAESSKNTDVPSEIRKFQRSMESFNHLAQNEDWLADQYDEIIHSQDAPQYEVVGKGFDRKAIAESEEHILRCKLQRELFDTAGSLGDLPQTVTLRGQIARFLHNHKDEEKPVDCISKPNDERKA